MTPEQPKKGGPGRDPKIKGDPKHKTKTGTRPTPERPPAPRVPPKRPGG